MDLKNVKTFVRVTELNSFSKAAEELNYAQSTVTMQIQQLEKELGYPLFDRVGKTVSLTSLGKEFLSNAYEILHIIRRSELLNKNADSIHGILRVGVSESLMLGVLMEILPEFKKKYKNLELSIKSYHTTELLEGLKHNLFDIVYISNSMNTDPDLVCHYSRKENLVFLSSPDDCLSQKRLIQMSELMERNFLVTEHEGICYSRLCELAAQHGVRLCDSVEIDNVFVITRLVQRGMGLAFLPEYAICQQIKDGLITKLDVDISSQTYYSQILCHKSRWMSPFMLDFIDIVKSARPEI